MRENFLNQMQTEVSQEEIFHIGLGKFFEQDKKNVKRVFAEKLIDFSIKNHMLVDLDFFLEISQLGEKILCDKTAKLIKQNFYKKK